MYVVGRLGKAHRVETPNVSSFACNRGCTGGDEADHRESDSGDSVELLVG